MASRAAGGCRDPLQGARMLRLALWLSEPPCPEISGQNCKLSPLFPCEKCFGDLL